MPTGQILIPVADGQGNVTDAVCAVTVGDPGGIGHGSEIPPLSADAETFLDVASGPLAEYPGTGSVTLSGVQVLENRSFTNRLVLIAAGADITLRNCLLQGPLGQTSYTLRSVLGGEAKLTLERCLLIARTTTSTTPRCLTVWNPVNVRAWRCVFRGGIDNVYANAPATAGSFLTGDPVVPSARLWFEECWFGDIQRAGASHSDCIQFDGGGYALLRRCRVMGYELPEGSDPLTVRITDPASALMNSGPVIATQNSANPNQLAKIVLRDCWVEGGNYTVDLAPPDGLPPQLMAISGCRWGVRHRFGPLRLPPSMAEQPVDNLWGQSGGTACCGTVAAGDPL